MSGRCVDVLRRVKSLIGRYTDVIQSWVVGCDGRPGSFPTMHVLCRLCSRSPKDLLTTWHDFLTLYPRLLLIPDHPRSFWTVQNNREQSGTPRPSSPTSQDLPRPIRVLSRLPYDFTRPFPTIKVGKGRLSGRLKVRSHCVRVRIRFSIRFSFRVRRTVYTESEFLSVFDLISCPQLPRQTSKCDFV